LIEPLAAVIWLGSLFRSAVRRLLSAAIRCRARGVVGITGVEISCALLSIAKEPPAGSSIRRVELTFKRPRHAVGRGQILFVGGALSWSPLKITGLARRSG